VVGVARAVADDGLRGRNGERPGQQRGAQQRA